MSSNHNADGPIVVWDDYGCEGWQPSSYPTIADAVKAGLAQGSVVTKRIKIEEFVHEGAAR